MNRLLRLAAVLEIPVTFADLDGYGYIVGYRGRYAIAINANLPPEQQRYVLAHELGHALTGELQLFKGWESMRSDPDRERIADYAAALILGKNNTMSYYSTENRD